MQSKFDNGGNKIMLNYDALLKFEKQISEYTGAPYVVLTDSCTHAIELCLRYRMPFEKYSIPKHTYLSIPMLFYKLRYSFEYNDDEWEYEYQIKPTNIWDSARAFDRGMFRKGQLQCLSFGHTKRLEIGHGGAILTGSSYIYHTIKKMAYDGRDLSVSPWQDQTRFELGFHYNMRLEDARKGTIMMNRQILKDKNTQIVNYPDCSKLNIDSSIKSL
jgi:hypothetical protein